MLYICYIQESDKQTEWKLKLLINPPDMSEVNENVYASTI